MGSGKATQRRVDAFLSEFWGDGGIPIREKAVLRFGSQLRIWISHQTHTNITVRFEQLSFVGQGRRWS